MEEEKDLGICPMCKNLQIGPKHHCIRCQFCGQFFQRIKTHEKYCLKAPTASNNSLNDSQRNNNASMQMPIDSTYSETYKWNSNTSESFNDAPVFPNIKKCVKKKTNKAIGWATTIYGDTRIPYFFCNGEKCCAVRMMETQLLIKYFEHLPDDVTKWIKFQSYFLTDSEAALLNEVNSRHFSYQFGSSLFTASDLYVRLDDAVYFFHFIESCYKALVICSSELNSKCGFYKVNEFIMSYVIKSDVKYVPFFYFRGDTGGLKERTTKVESWDLAYLKLCFRLQGLAVPEIEKNVCEVISMDDVRFLFPPDAVFEEWWPFRESTSVIEDIKDPISLNENESFAMNEKKSVGLSDCTKILSFEDY